MKVDRYKKDIDRLVAVGNNLLAGAVLEHEPERKEKLKITPEQIAALPKMSEDYQRWYSEALACLTQLLPDRVEDFISYYKPDKPRKEITYQNYTISDYLQGLTITRGWEKTLVVDPKAALPCLKQQVQIIEAIKQKFESSLFDIRALVQADFFDDELDAAEELNRKGFHRAAGAISGVVLEEHLAAICDNHKVKRPKNPAISELNDLLKKAEITDLPTWRFIQRLGDLRNLCDHKKEADPSKENMTELIEGVRKIIKTVF